MFHNLPGNVWWDNFLSTHPELKLKTAEKLKMTRTMSQSKRNVCKWFLSYKTTLQEFSVESSSLISNCDEPGFPLQTNPRQVVVVLSFKSCYQLSSNNKMKITGLICIDADGSVLPPLVLFPGKFVRPAFTVDLSPGSAAYVTDSGWMTKIAFYYWLQYIFIPLFSPKSNRETVVLIFHGHATHKDYYRSSLL